MIGSELSIIMPCYNCETTLREAVNSIYTQNLTIPFEVVMVDDGSTDKTRDLIKQLSNEYKEIKYIFHDKNEGGGVARNTAVENSKSDIIFCLDSDNILGEGCLKILYEEYKKSDNIDGVALNIRKYFYGNDLSYTDDIIYTNESVKFETLFTKNENPITDNFLYTKKSFYRAGGYPTYHGFDTQGYGFRWLSSGNKAVVANGSFYYHRQNPVGKKSYFEREFEQGKISEYYYFILEEIFYLLNDQVKEFILRFDTKKFIDLDESLFQQLLNRFDKDSILINNYQTYLNINFEEMIIKDKYYFYWKGVKYYREGKYFDALITFVEVKKEISYSLYLDYYILDCLTKLNKNFNVSINEYINKMSNFVNRNTKGYVGTRQNIFQRIKNKIRKYRR